MSKGFIYPTSEQIEKWKWLDSDNDGIVEIRDIARYLWLRLSKDWPELKLSPGKCELAVTNIIEKCFSPEERNAQVRIDSFAKLFQVAFNALFSKERNIAIEVKRLREVKDSEHPSPEHLSLVNPDLIIALSAVETLSRVPCKGMEVSAYMGRYAINPQMQRLSKFDNKLSNRAPIYTADQHVLREEEKKGLEYDAIERMAKEREIQRTKAFRSQFTNIEWKEYLLQRQVDAAARANDDLPNK